jgi:tripeptidyl-peptidase-1
MAIVGFNPNSYTQTDLDLFFTTFATESIGTFPTLVSINGGVVNQTPDPAGGTNQEGDLDLEYVRSLALPSRSR